MTAATSDLRLCSRRTVSKLALLRKPPCGPTKISLRYHRRLITDSRAGALKETWIGSEAEVRVGTSDGKKSLAQSEFAVKIRLYHPEHDKRGVSPSESKPVEKLWAFPLLTGSTWVCSQVPSSRCEYAGCELGVEGREWHPAYYAIRTARMSPERNGTFFAMHIDLKKDLEAHGFMARQFILLQFSLPMFQNPKKIQKSLNEHEGYRGIFLSSVGRRLWPTFVNSATLMKDRGYLCTCLGQRHGSARDYAVIGN
ncbi:hypothetical protein B0H16DRAFT_1805875 [Mycena metata]|uniref:Uncharacterized protein n=1 Tax=Mycena metata TaxID=1033252 RepID=A0AAD7JEB3_9AGAR|nr:hypothetical protein B0H16DRAFT_1805875 [Mycena metata]